MPNAVGTLATIPNFNTAWEGSHRADSDAIQRTRSEDTK